MEDQLAVLQRKEARQLPRLAKETQTEMVPNTLPPPSRATTDSTAVEDFEAKWHLLHSYVERERQRDRKHVVVSSVSRNAVVTTLMRALGWPESFLKHIPNIFRSLVVEGFRGEEVVDEGGASREIFSLFFEQLQDFPVDLRVGGQGLAGAVVPVKLFQPTVEDGRGIYLPVQVKEDNEDLFRVFRSTAEVRTTYFFVGRVLAKSILEGCPVPPVHSSDLLLDFLLGELPDQVREGGRNKRDT